MKYRQALVFSYQRFENALISIISIRSLTRITPILNFPILSQKRDLDGTFKCCFKNSLPNWRDLFPENRFFFIWRWMTTALKEFRVSNNQQYYMRDTRHLLERIDGHKQKSSSVYKQFSNKHNYTATPTCLLEQFDVFAKCYTKFDCLITEVFFIRIIRITIPQPTN